MSTVNQWADRLRVSSVEVRQLLVPAGMLDVAEVDGGVWVTGTGGRWRAARLGQDVVPDDGLVARLSAHLPTRGARVERWEGGRTPIAPDDVLRTYGSALRLDPASELRRAQRGALYSVLGYWESGLQEPALVVMPTGTGKTDTMIALMVAAAPRLLLIMVPTVALRDQIAGAFERLGVLQALGVVAPTALRPPVCRLEHGLDNPDDVQQLVAASTVVVATPAALAACGQAARDTLLDRASHLFVDEAHHSAAATWASVIAAFPTRPVVLFTATPFREDGQALPGRVIYRFPLREAQREDYFAPIDHHAVLSLTAPDRAVAELAIARLDADIAAGYDHLLMARVSSQAAARDLEKLYRELAPQYEPRAIYADLAAGTRKKILQDLRGKRSRIIICVDMLGEGFDLPELKIAAVHDPRRSVGPMLQFIGRFVRSSRESALGRASVFIARDPALASSPLRALLREDADWNALLRDMTDRRGAAVEELDAFEASFRGMPDEVPVSLLKPTMSAVAHRAPTASWNPDKALGFYGADHVVGGDVAVGGSPGPGGGTIAWLIVETVSHVRWAAAGPALREVGYELILLRFDHNARVLFIHGSEKGGTYGELARAVLGQAAEPITGTATFRVLDGVDRILVTNVGLLDARDQFTRYSMHVGSDVAAALENAEARGRTQTHIATSGYDQGEPTTVCASLGGRFWSMRHAENIKDWSEWCDAQTPKLLDSTIDLTRVFSSLIIPEDLTKRPPLILLGLEWPWDLYLRSRPGPMVRVGDEPYPATDIEFVVDDHTRNGAFRFTLRSPTWTLAYRAEFVHRQGLTYRPVDADAVVSTSPGRPEEPLRGWLNRRKPLLLLEDDRVIDAKDRLLAPRTDLLPFDPARFSTLDWNGIDIRVESQGPERRRHSVQAHMSRVLQEREAFSVLIDDDRSGEAADLVGLHADHRELTVTLVHCKYSGADSPGARSSDLYELCGQAVRGAKWRQHAAEPLLRHLHRRVQAYAMRTGVSAFEVGDFAELIRLRETAPQLRIRFRSILAQPGLSARHAGLEQLQLLAGVESYLVAATHGSLEVFTSP